MPIYIWPMKLLHEKVNVNSIIAQVNVGDVETRISHLERNIAAGLDNITHKRLIYDGFSLTVHLSLQ